MACFYISAVNNVAVNIDVQTSVGFSAFNSFGYMWKKNGIAGS